jgi:hypothetical protein
MLSNLTGRLENGTSPPGGQLLVLHAQGSRKAACHGNCYEFCFYECCMPCARYAAGQKKILCPNIVQRWCVVFLSKPFGGPDSCASSQNTLVPSQLWGGTETPIDHHVGAVSGGCPPKKKSELLSHLPKTINTIMEKEVDLGRQKTFLSSIPVALGYLCRPLFVDVEPSTICR